MASIGSVLGAVGNTIPTASSTSSANSSSANSSANSTDSLANESTFLQLLVTQLQNQDPTEPMDSTAFLGELAQFSQLEQLVNINQDLQTGIPVTSLPATATSNGTSPASSTTAS